MNGQELPSRYHMWSWVTLVTLPSLQRAKYLKHPYSLLLTIFDD